MVRLCSESSRSYSGRPAIAPRRKRRERGSAMTPERWQESAEAVVPRATSRTRRYRRASQLGKGSTGQAEHDHRWSCSRGDEADWPSPGQRSPWQRKSAASSARTARNRRTRTRMSGGVGGGGGNPPPEPIKALANVSVNPHQELLNGHQCSYILRPARSLTPFTGAFYTKGFEHFIASMLASAATGCNESCRVGLLYSPTGVLRLCHGAL